LIQPFLEHNINPDGNRHGNGNLDANGDGNRHSNGNGDGNGQLRSGGPGSHGPGSAVAID
jgi:hypothetical protein